MVNFKWPCQGVPGRFSRLSVRLSVSAQVTISRFTGSSPTAGSARTVQSLPGVLSLSLSLCPSHARALSLSLKINKHLKKYFLRARETECVWWRGRERERETESKAGSRL